MRRSLRCLGLATALLTPLGCGEDDPGPACTERACAGGFDLWITSTNVSDVFDAGPYRVIIEVDGGELEVRCTVDDAGQGRCGAPEWDERPAPDLTARVDFGVPSAQAAIETPAIQIHLEGRSDAPAGTNVFGPTMLVIEVWRDIDRLVQDQTLTPQYERDEEFNGPADCGFCDSLEREVIRLPG